MTKKQFLQELRKSGFINPRNLRPIVSKLYPHLISRPFYAKKREWDRIEAVAYVCWTGAKNRSALEPLCDWITEQSGSIVSINRSALIHHHPNRPQNPNGWTREGLNWNVLRIVNYVVFIPPMNDPPFIPQSPYPTPAWIFE